YDGALAPEHRLDLEASTIREETWLEQGIRSVPPSDFDRLLGFRVPSEVRSLMLLPYPDPAGGYFDEFQVKLFPALVDSAGHAVKYLQRRRSGPRAYFVRRVLPLVMDSSQPLFVVEGAKKVLAAVELGLGAVGFAGINAWHTK